MKSSKMFKDQLSEEDRKKESSKILNNFSDRVPIIVEKGKKSQLPDLDMNKFNSNIS